MELIVKMTILEAILKHQSVIKEKVRVQVIIMYFIGATIMFQEDWTQCVCNQIDSTGDT